MKTPNRFVLACLLLTASCLAAQDAAAKTFTQALGRATAKTTPFQNNNGVVPPKSVYSGPLFTLNHAWPAQAPAPLKNAPWQAAIHNGTITTQNAPLYAAALKAAVAQNARQLIAHYDTWDAAKAGWYNEPWLGSKREAIRGTYDAGEFAPAIFPGTGLQGQFDTHVLTYYDARAAYALRQVCGTTAMNPNLNTQAMQIPEGGIVVKAAIFTSEDKTKPLGWWTAMNGAQTWNLYMGVGPQGNTNPPQVWPGYVAQFDIIVKDSQSSPKTGWVFMTLVYDSAASGDFWDKLVPLGVQWGNDPQATDPAMPLQETWNNPQAPLYSTQTLGWGKRLSGPNDGATNDITVGSVAMTNAPDSGCMSCHSTAEWNATTHQMASFLLPSFPSAAQPGFELCDANGKPDQKHGQYICSPAPSSTAWMKWFQDRLGTEAMDAGSFATDFDEVFSFKSLNLWWAATGGANKFMPMLLQVPSHGQQRFNQYTGAPLPKP
jgi:hypothetical protein